MFKRLSIALAAIAIALAAPGVASAAVTLPPGVVQTSGTTFAYAAPGSCSCVTAIDGYVFSGFPYSPYVRDWLRSQGMPAPDATAVDLWLDLKAQPGYTPGAPITSISTTATVTGTVNDPPSV